VGDKPASYHTQLPPMVEQMFQSWVAQNKVPFDPGPKADYDMRGFYNGLITGDPRASNAIDPNDGRLHYPDHWKTPYHETFSNESQWARADAPMWNAMDQLKTKDGAVLFDDRAANPSVPLPQLPPQAALYGPR
jgi:hypothetical protein